MAEPVSPTRPGVAADPVVTQRDDTPAQRHRSVTPDRWEWRRRLRSGRRRRAAYRSAVAGLGGLLVVLGLVTGPLPGPGGIPLVLLGLAVWASEFVWAHRLLQRARREVERLARRARARPRWQRWAGGAGALAVGLGGAWLALSVTGVPAVVPEVAATWLVALPGVEAR